MTSACMRIKEKEKYNVLTVTAHHVPKNHVAAGVYKGVESVTSANSVWLVQLRNKKVQTQLDYKHNMTAPKSMHLSKLKGKFVSLNTYYTKK